MSQCMLAWCAKFKVPGCTPHIERTMVMDRPFEVIAHVKRRETKMSSGDPLTLELRGGDETRE